MPRLASVKASYRCSGCGQPCWATDDQLVAAVKVAKRTADYRRYRPRLRSLWPTDVWLDDNRRAYFVLFPLTSTTPGHEELLGFTIDAANRIVTRASPLSVRLTKDALIVENIGPAVARAVGDQRVF
jgi:hypothetical protein